MIPDHVIKLVLLGDMNVGKTNLVLRFIYNEFNDFTQNTIGFDFKNKIIEIYD